MNPKILEIVSNWRRMGKKKWNKFVTVDYGRLKKIARNHFQDKFQIPDWRFAGVYPEHNLVFASYQIIVNAFNFAFNIFEKPDEKYMIANPMNPAKPFSGAFALDRIFYQTFGERIIQSRDLALHFRSIDTAAKFFQGLNQIPLPDLRYQCARDLIEGLENHYQGNPLNLIEEAMERGRLRAFNNGRGLVELLVRRFPIAYGQDVQKLQLGKQALLFSFYKRAQLVPVILHGRAVDSRGVIPLVADIEAIGPIADYEIPKALRAMGILKYSKELVSCVDEWQEVPKNTQMEVEIRAAMVAVCCQLIESINQGRKKVSLPPINICHLDYWLWKMGVETARNFRPHLTRTSSY